MCKHDVRVITVNDREEGYRMRIEQCRICGKVITKEIRFDLFSETAIEIITPLFAVTGKRTLSHN